MEKRSKTGGRAKGVPNRTTAETKDFLQKVINKELDGIGDLMEGLTAKERIDAVIKLLPYIVPKQAEVIIEPKEFKYEPLTVTLIEK